MILRNIVKDRYLLYVFGLSTLILLFNFIFVFSSLNNPNANLIIHFDAYKGIDFLSTRGEVFGILLVASTMLIVNLFLANFLYRRDIFLSYILTFVTLAIAILILIVVSVIISVN